MKSSKHISESHRRTKLWKCYVYIWGKYWRNDHVPLISHFYEIFLYIKNINSTYKISLQILGDLVGSVESDIILLS